MRIESVDNIVTMDPFRTRKAHGGSETTAPALTNQDKEVEHSQKTLQKQTRPTDEIKKEADEIKKEAEEIKKGIEELNGQLATMNRSIQFSVDQGTHDIVVRVVDKQSGEVIKELPPESILRLRERMEELSGLMVEEQV